MRKILLLTVIVTVLVLAITVIISFTISGRLASRFRERYSPTIPKIIFPIDSASLARGKMLSSAVCAYCHGNDFAGGPIYNNWWYEKIYAENITPGGVTKDFSEMDWINAIRYGVKKNGTPTFIMPSYDDVDSLSDTDLRCIIAYVKTVKSSTRLWPSNRESLTFTGRLVNQIERSGRNIVSAEKKEMDDIFSRPVPMVGQLLPMELTL